MCWREKEAKVISCVPIILFNICLSLRNYVITELIIYRQDNLIPDDCPFTYAEVVEQQIDEFNEMLENFRDKIQGNTLR